MDRKTSTPQANEENWPYRFDLMIFAQLTRPFVLCYIRPTMKHRLGDMLRDNQR
jgi:hypothetical protein